MAAATSDCGRIDMARTYGQFCPLAKTLDLVGERWTMLILRELMLGSRRYSDLLDGLPGIGTSMLSDRLKRLEAGGVISRAYLPPPAASQVYELTESGSELVPALIALGRWGTRLLSKPKKGEAVRVDLIVLFLESALDPSRTIGVRECYELHVDKQTFHIRADDGRVEVAAGRAPGRAALVMRTDAATFADIGCGRIERGAALASGRIRISGDQDAIARYAWLMDSVREPAEAR